MKEITIDLLYCICGCGYTTDEFDKYDLEFGWLCVCQDCQDDYEKGKNNEQ
jgi:hypothetical protein